MLSLFLSSVNPGSTLVTKAHLVNRKIGNAYPFLDKITLLIELQLANALLRLNDRFRVQLRVPSVALQGPDSHHWSASLIKQIHCPLLKSRYECFGPIVWDVRGS